MVKRRHSEEELGALRIRHIWFYMLYHSHISQLRDLPSAQHCKQVKTKSPGKQTELRL